MREDEATRHFLQAVTRRHFFREAGFGIGSVALTSLLERAAVRRRPGPGAAPTRWP